VVKKYLSSNIPRGVAMYLFEVTRLTVLSCISTAVAMWHGITTENSPCPVAANLPVIA